MKGSSQAGKPSPTELHSVSYMHNGIPDRVAVELPANAGADYLEEATHFVQTLEDNGQIQHEPGPLKPGKTHRVETDAKGNKVLVRKGFTAI